MNISSSFNFLPSANTLSAKRQGIFEVVQKINDVASEAAAKRKALAVERMKGLQERLQVMMLFAAIGIKGNAETAAQVAKEIAATVKDYADASGTTNTDAGGFNQADENFLGLAKVLSYQVKAIISFEAAKAKYPEKHQSAIYQMDTAINDAEKSLHRDQMASLYIFDGSTLALLQSHFSTTA